MKIELKQNKYFKIYYIFLINYFSKIIFKKIYLLNAGWESKLTINSPGTWGSEGLFNMAVPSATCGAPVLYDIYF